MALFYKYSLWAGLFDLQMYAMYVGISPAVTHKKSGCVSEKQLKLNSTSWLAE